MEGEVNVPGGRKLETQLSNSTPSLEISSRSRRLEDSREVAL